MIFFVFTVIKGIICRRASSLSLKSLCRAFQPGGCSNRTLGVHIQAA